MRLLFLVLQGVVGVTQLSTFCAVSLASHVFDCASCGNVSRTC